MQDDFKRKVTKQELAEYAMQKMTFYMCYKCNNSYFGGLKECNNNIEQPAELPNGNIDRSSLVCVECRLASIKKNGAKAKCAKHGTKFVTFKCRFCCSLATYFCGGTTHYCTACHNDAGRL